jgi:hypothetical protein
VKLIQPASSRHNATHSIAAYANIAGTTLLIVLKFEAYPSEVEPDFDQGAA